MAYKLDDQVSIPGGDSKFSVSYDAQLNCGCYKMDIGDGAVGLEGDHLPRG
jgi:hypothetical protein